MDFGSEKISGQNQIQKLDCGMVAKMASVVSSGALDAVTMLT